MFLIPRLPDSSELPDQYLSELVLSLGFHTLRTAFTLVSFISIGYPNTTMRMRDWVILSGNSNRPLAQKICEKLGKPLGHAEVRSFSDGEVFVEVQENVRGRDVYVIQSTCRPVNDTLMELLIMIDALRRASAKEITAVIPYFGYARQDRKVAPRTPISAKLAANLLTAAGATRMVSMDLHAGQIQGFFDIPSDNLFSSPVL